MNLEIGGVRVRVLPAAAAALLVLSWAVHAAFVRPQLDEVRRLEARRATLLQQAGQSGELASQTDALAEKLGASNPADIVRLGRGPDPVTYLGSVLDHSGLHRLELATSTTGMDSTFERSQSTVRVTGDYDHIVRFVRELEEGLPLASVDALLLEQLPGDRTLEGRFIVTLYRPLEGARP